MRVDPSKFIPTSDSTSEQWIEFHKSLKKWFSKNEANSHLLRFWGQRAGAGTEADTHDLRSYMESQDVNLTTDMKGNAQDSVLGITEWLGDTANMLRVVLIGGLVLGAGLMAYYVIKKANNSSGSIIPNSSLKSAPAISPPVKIIP